MTLINNSQKEWLQKGGSAQALELIDSVVTKLHQKALDENIVFKSANTDAEVEQTETEEDSNTETESETETKDAEIVSEETEAISEEEVSEEQPETEPEAPENVESVNFVDVLTESIFAAQKQYHNDVVVPLITELESVRKELSESKKTKGLFDFDATSLLPAAAVAEKIKKEFAGKKETTETDGELKGDSTTEKSVTEHEITSFDDANLFANF